MPPRKEYWSIIKDEEHFFTYFCEDNKRLMVLDVHPQWSGPCDLMFPTYKSCGTMIDDFDKRLNFLLMDQEVIAHCQNIKIDKFRNYFKSDCTSRPKFLFIMVIKVFFIFDFRKGRLWTRLKAPIYLRSLRKLTSIFPW